MTKPKKTLVEISPAMSADEREHGAELIVVTETSADGRIWGRANYGNDLLVCSEESEQELINSFEVQLNAFYQADGPFVIKLKHSQKGLGEREIEH